MKVPRYDKVSITRFEVTSICPFCLISEVDQSVCSLLLMGEEIGQILQCGQRLKDH